MKLINYCTVLIVVAIGACSDETTEWTRGGSVGSGGDGGSPASDGGSGGEGGGDEPFDASVGPIMSEDDACAILFDAQSAAVKHLGCSITIRTCPTLTRVMSGVGCAEYDALGVQACANAYGAAPTCQGLEDQIANCKVAFIPPSAPCP
jgi:hypothetical protein